MNHSQKIITKCTAVCYKLRQLSLLQSDSYYKFRQLFYYKARHGLLQIATGITNCDDYYKLRQYNLYVTILISAHIRKKDIQNFYIEEGWLLSQVAPAFLQSGVSWLCTTVLSLFLSSDLSNFSSIKHHFKLWCCR